MKTIRIFCMAILASVLVLTSCKDDDKEEQAAPQQASNEAGFYYAENGSTTLTKTESVQANAQYKTIMAQNGKSVVVEIVLTDLKVGTYSLSDKYAFTYVKDNKYWEATDGTLIITKNDGKVLSGTYEATAGAGVEGVTKVTGKFNDVTIK